MPSGRQKKAYDAVAAAEGLPADPPAELVVATDTA
jgi:hypothetical protein